MATRLPRRGVSARRGLLFDAHEVAVMLAEQQRQQRVVGKLDDRRVCDSGPGSSSRLELSAIRLNAAPRRGSASADITLFATPRGDACWRR
jgi:hypothetical protein